MATNIQMDDGKGVDETPEVRPRKRSLLECLAICGTACNSFHVVVPWYAKERCPYNFVFNVEIMSIRLSEEESFFCLCAIAVSILVGLGITKIVIGATYLHECELQTMIPIFLIVSGVAPVVSGGGARRNKENKNTAATFCASIGLMLNIAWTIAGSVWVYPTWDMIKKGSNLQCATNATICKTCNDVVLTFAFAMVTVDWLVIGLVIIIIACSICATVRK